MIKLENIKIDGNIISAIVSTVETKPQVFKIAIDIKEERLVECTRDTRDSYVYQAMGKLIQLYRENRNDMPTKAESVWY